MVITENVRVPPAFREGLARCNSLNEKLKFITAQVYNPVAFHRALATMLTYSYQMGWDGEPGFAEATSGGCKATMPLFNDCTIVLLHGRMQLDDDERTFIGDNAVVRAEGSKTLTIIDKSGAVWYPAPCCWDVNECHLSLKGQCKRLGIGKVRQVDNTSRGYFKKLFSKIHQGLSRSARA